jgi:cell division transport system permease protein
LPAPPAGTAPDQARLQRAVVALAAVPEVAEARPMDQARLAALLRPWLGEAPALPLPAVVELRLHHLPDDPAGLAARLAAAVPGGVVEAHGVWVARLVALAHSVQGVAVASLALVAGIATAVVAVAISAGLAARRQAIGILHDLGATDGDIAGRFAVRIAWLAGLGGLLGVALAAPVLAGLASLAAPVLGGSLVGEAGTDWAALAGTLPWAALALLPLATALLGWLTAQVTVRRWLLRLP